MRFEVTEEKLQEFMTHLGRTARGPGRIYIVGGSSALLLGIRSQTIDIDLKLDPEPLGVFESIASIKERLQVNVELAAPDQFVPPLAGWRERSEFILQVGQVDFYHYDFYGQALAKIDRGQRKDLSDVRALIRMKKVEPQKLVELLESAKPAFPRYTNLNYETLLQQVRDFLGDIDGP